MNNNFKILACFTRSYDKYHNSDNLHLIASTVLLRDKIESGKLLTNIRNSDVSRKFIIVLRRDVLNTNDEIFISEDLLPENRNKQIDKTKIFEDEYLGYIQISFNNLSKLYSSKENTDYIKSLFNYGETDTKTEDQIYTQCLFVFNNITWSNIVFKFKINNIDISGGGTNTRHILTSSDIILNNYLNMIYNYNSEYIINLGFYTYKNEKDLMSSQIPLNLYRTYLDKIIEIYKLNPEDVFNKIKLLTSEIESSSNNSFIKIIANNLLISRDIIIQKMILHYKNNLIEKTKKMLEEKKSERSTYNSKYETLLSNNKYLSNKSKKQLKKEKKEILNNGLNFDNISGVINKYDLEISDLENKLAVKKEELDKIIENLKKLSFGELFQQYEGIKHKINYGGFNYNIFSKYKKQKNIRNYSTYLFRDKYNINNMSIDIAPNDVLISQKKYNLSSTKEKNNINNSNHYNSSYFMANQLKTINNLNILRKNITMFQNCREYSIQHVELKTDVNTSGYAA